MSDAMPSTAAATSGTKTNVEPSSSVGARPRLKWPDACLAILVLAFAFLAASFPASNSDLWLHLASGRAMADGEYSFGADPFGYTTQNVYWTNHAWLFDLALFAGFETVGGTGLVVFKAAAILVLAVLMLYCGRHAGPFWISGGFVLLAILAMSPRLLLQPACLSLLMLSVCLVLLLRGGRARFAVLAVIALWVNLDSWFLLGPLLVILFATGQRLAPAMVERQRIPLWLIPASVAACLISPHHYHALTLPAELSPAVWNSELRHDARLAYFFARPWSSGLPWSSGMFNAAACAYFVLLFSSAVSFAVNHRALRSWRLPVWVSFALLGAWQTRLVPFFAVVAGPIAALNFRERMIGRPWLLVGRSALTCLSLGLLALTWPGWLQGLDRRDRPLAWEIRPDPSLERVATKLARLRQSGIVPTGTRSFANHPDVAHYCVWYCPGEKVFLDSRLTLFATAAADFERVCQHLDPALRAESAMGDSPAACERILETNRVGFLILHHPNPGRLAPSLRRLNATADRWDLLSIDGTAVIVGRQEWRGLDGPKRFNAESLVYGASDDAILGEAPAHGPAELADRLDWWERYAIPTTGTTWEAGAAAFYLSLFEEGSAAQLDRQGVAVLSRYAAGLVGLPAAQSGVIPPSVLLGSRFALADIFLPDLMERPAELPLLAVRAARRAVAAHPDDANAWLTLAQAYIWLKGFTAEGTGFVSFAPLVQLRRIQIAAALVQAIEFRPDLSEAHELLAHLYAESDFLDLALRHWEIQLKLVRRAGAAAGEDAAAFAARIGRLEEAVGQKRRQVQDKENRFVVHSHALTGNPLARARLAQQLGLAGKAVDDVLLRSHADLYGVDGLKLLLEVLLLSGRSREARELLSREELKRNPDALGTYALAGNRAGQRRWSYDLVAYDWFDFCAAAAAGGYEDASATIDRMRRRIRGEGEALLATLRPAFAFRLSSEVAQGAVPVPLLLHFSAQPERERLMGLIVRSLFLPVEIADMHALDGMILLERGWPAVAAEQFNKALEIYKGVPITVPALPGKPLAQKHLARIHAAR